MKRFLGIDLGGTKLLVYLMDAEGQVVKEILFPTGRHATPTRVLELIQRAASELGKFTAIGLGFPGLVDSARGSVLFVAKLEGWNSFPLAREVEQRFGCPCVIDNDVNMAARAEIWLRQQTPAGMLYVAIGTGIGGALVIHGEPWGGASGMAGEIGHMIIDRTGSRSWNGIRGCLNAFASGTAIEEDLGIPPGSLADRVTRRDLELDQALARASRALGTGLGNAVHLLAPDLVVLGGGVSMLGPPFLDAVEKATLEVVVAEVECRFELARAGYGAGALGAGLAARALVEGSGY